MVDNSVLKLDNKSYLVVDTITKDTCKYIYLVNQEDDNDFLIRKQVVRDMKNYLCPLSSLEEFKMTLELFQEKNQES